MSRNYNIRILEKEPNKKGDLFGRLMSDLFLALAYDEIRLNIHKTGREIDLIAIHRTEPKRVVAECKATKTKTGGNALNKFVGVLDIERRKEKKLQTIGYFVSLSGFKETAIEQEKEYGKKRVILIDGSSVIEQLINGHIIVAPEIVMERAGRCASKQSNNLKPEKQFELLAHNIGWIWLVYFTQNKEKTHYTLIHADGEFISKSLTDEIIKADSKVGGILKSLIYLPPIEDILYDESQIKQAKERYFQYLRSECGEITLEGLPADQEVGSRHLKLESIFVPLFLEIAEEYERGISIPQEKIKHNGLTYEREPVGKILKKFSRIAILAAPGGGKTTLLKRIAIAYAFSERRELIDDNLPARQWFPLFIRCRQLGDLANSPISEILFKIPYRAEIVNLSGAFIRLVNEALKNGSALLLVDGLDEISDEGLRIAFVKQLRTFLATYPKVNILISSRETGFRIVGGSLCHLCKHFKVAEFDDEDIKRLTVAWHKEVVGDRQDIISESLRLADSICENNRVKQLAKNPLLLTTLLLVKRWVGQLPTKRSVLYGKAIEVLLMTWNVEGYEPIDPEEAIPQLAFVAYIMIKKGIQRISIRELKNSLKLARKQMPELLGYSRLSISDFITSVERRSSILILSGHEIEQGTIYPMYEFRHLTFQEYLAAVAIVNGFYPKYKESDTILSILKPHLEDENWKEIIPLTAVLAGRKVQPLIKYLISLCKRKRFEERKRRTEIYPSILLAQCIIDEIQIQPDLLKESIEWVARRKEPTSNYIKIIYKGKYGKELKEVVKSSFIKNNNDLLNLGGALSEITCTNLNIVDKSSLTPKLVDKIFALLDSEILIKKAAGALAVMYISYSFHVYPPREKKVLSPDEEKIFKKLGQKLVPIIYLDEGYCFFSACWAFAWLGEIRGWTPAYNPHILSRLLEIWQVSDSPEIKYVASWAISCLPLIDRAFKPFPKPNEELLQFIKNQYSQSLKGTISKRLPVKIKNNIIASFVTAYYLKSPWTDKELASNILMFYKKFYTTIKNRFDLMILKNILKNLGEHGKSALAFIEKVNLNSK